MVTPEDAHDGSVRTEQSFTAITKFAGFCNFD